MLTSSQNVGSRAFRREKQFHLLEAAMDYKGCSTIPRPLHESITFLAKVLPVRSVPTFIELLVGAMLTQTGFVTDAWLAINPLRTWTAYYKWLQEGKWSWVALGVQLARFVVTFFPQQIWSLIFDDTFIYRCSKKAPGWESTISTATKPTGHSMPEDNAG